MIETWKLVVYYMLAFPKNDALRLDYILATKPPAKGCTAAEIDRQKRRGEKPSDHAAVNWCRSQS
jgi:exodeoxyribonuclease-3